MSSVLLEPVKVIGGSFFSYVGKVSYGIYLFHMLVINFCKKVSIFQNDTLVIFAVASFITIIIAAIVFNFFEKPILKFKNKFTVIP